jgi:hypothetical protein
MILHHCINVKAEANGDAHYFETPRRMHTGPLLEKKRRPILLLRDLTARIEQNDGKKTIKQQASPQGPKTGIG